MRGEYLRRHRRRTVLRALGAGSIVGLAGCTGSDTEVSPTEIAHLAATDGDTDDSFGFSVALGDEIALIVAPSDEDPNGEGAGAAYVFDL